MQAARDARDTFGDDAGPQLAETLRIVGEAAKELGIDVGDKVRALLDAHAATFAGGTISLHNEQGVPLRGLGIGSTRLLIAGLQQKAAAQSSVVLVDELEHGLEPHRIIRFLGSLGAKEKMPPLQIFMTTHSPVALRELSGSQLFVLREAGGQHVVMNVGTDDGIQSTIRVYPDAFLAPSVLVCEGASEVGLMRGLDQYLTAQGNAASRRAASHWLIAEAAMPTGLSSAPLPSTSWVIAWRCCGMTTRSRRSVLRRPSPTPAARSSRGGKTVRWKTNCFQPPGCGGQQDAGLRDRAPW